ncbi:MAG: GNAT family N-acetyltransferase [Chloroflexi bacterium]|nr:GNAT family N-acetyltransferase [Chloroflexota bacterium]
MDNNRDSRGKTNEHVTYVEMTSLERLIAGRPPSRATELRIQAPPAPELSESLYKAVGGDWRWTERLPWGRKEWSDYVLRPDVETWTLLVEETMAGYAEFIVHDDNSVEIAQFGLVPDFIGQGLGGHMLTLAVEQAWKKQPSRVWLHTSNFDHPHALENYQARGFRIFKKETLTHYSVEQPPAE